MPYQLLGNYVNQKSFKTYPEENLRIDIRLADAHNNPLELRQPTEDPGTFILRQFKWEFFDRRKGGGAQVFTNVSITDGDNGMVSLVVPPQNLVSSFGYRHALLMKWPSDPETAWDLVATGVIQVLTPQAGRSAVLG